MSIEFRAKGWAAELFAAVAVLSRGHMTSDGHDDDADSNRLVASKRIQKGGEGQQDGGDVVVT